MRRNKKNESGLAIVEATILLPLCLLMVMAMYYVAIFMCQKANLQANLENALLYYKNVETDTFVEANTEMAYSKADGINSAVGSAYGTPSSLIPYRTLGMKFDDTSFNQFARSMFGNMFFDTGENVVVTSKSTNYIVYKTIEATAVQTIEPAVSLEMVGIPNQMTITVVSEVVISDGDEFIRNTDMIIDLVSETELGQAGKDIIQEGVNLYKQFCDKIGVEVKD